MGSNNEGISSFLEWVKEMPSNLLKLGVRLIIIVLIFVIGRYAIRVIKKWILKLFTKSKIDKTIGSILDNVITVLLYLVLVLIILNVVGVQAATVAAVLASAGLSIGMGFQGALSNLAGGVLIIVTKPFVIGDWISDCPIDKGMSYEGEVTRISLTNTTIETIDGKTLFVPNSSLVSNSVVNYTRKGKRCVIVQTSISYGDDLKKAKALTERVVRSYPEYLDDMPMEVFVNELGDNGVELETRFWVPTNKYISVKHDILGRLKLEMEAEGITIPFPQIDIHFPAAREETADKTADETADVTEGKTADVTADETADNAIEMTPGNFRE